MLLKLNPATNQLTPVRSPPGAATLAPQLAGAWLAVGDAQQALDTLEPALASLQALAAPDAIATQRIAQLQALREQARAAGASSRGADAGPAETGG